MQNNPTRDAVMKILDRYYSELEARPQLVPFISRTHTGLTGDEILLEIAGKIVENFPKGIHADTDADLTEALQLIQEAGVYYGSMIHDEDPSQQCSREGGDNV